MLVIGVGWSVITSLDIFLPMLQISTPAAPSGGGWVASPVSGAAWAGAYDALLRWLT